MDDDAYQNTRSFLLSSANPFFFNGTAGEGIGGPHEGLGYIWPLSIIIRALTTNDDQQILQALQVLKASSAGTGTQNIEQTSKTKQQAATATMSTITIPMLLHFARCFAVSVSAFFSFLRCLLSVRVFT